MAANQRDTERFRQYLTIEQMDFFRFHSEIRSCSSFPNRFFLKRSALYVLFNLNLVFETAYTHKLYCKISDWVF